MNSYSLDIRKSAFLVTSWPDFQTVWLVAFQSFFLIGYDEK